MSKPTPDIIDNWPEFTKVFSQKSRIFWLDDGASPLVAMFVLSLWIVDGSIEKEGCKQGTVGVGGLCYIKIVFVLLIEVIAIYLQFSIV